MIGAPILVLLCVSAIVVFLNFEEAERHPSDQVLIQNLQTHRAAFEKLAHMAAQDSDVRTIYARELMFNDYKFWPKDEPNRFSWRRWEKYQSMFDALGSETMRQIDKDELVVMIPASIESDSPDPDYEYRVSLKGYAYSREPLVSVSSLDSVGLNDLGKKFRRIDGHWYLYHDCGIGKPE